MYKKSWTLILAPTLFLAPFLSPCFAGIVCDASLYGNPNPNECSKIRQVIISKDQKRHLFYTGTLEKRPSDVTLAEWYNRIETGGNKLDRDGCSVFIAPGYDDVQTIWHDTATYASLAEQAAHVQNYCSHLTAPDNDQAYSMEGGQGWIGKATKAGSSLSHIRTHPYSPLILQKV